MRIIVVMSEHWYVYIIIAALAALLYWGCDKLKILKSKPLRVFVVILISSIICWIIYDLVLAMGYFLPPS